MGAEVFQTVAKGETWHADDAFAAAVAEARREHGERGYSGSIAEKTDYVEIECSLPPDADRKTKLMIACAFADALCKHDERIDKWGPAGAIKLGNDEWLFFGWASA